MAQLGEPLADSALDDVLEVNEAEEPAVLLRQPASGVPPDFGNRIGDRAHFLFTILGADIRAQRFCTALPTRTAGELSLR